MLSGMAAMTLPLSVVTRLPVMRPVSFEFSGDQDLGTATYIFVTVETDGDTAQGPALLAGPVEGDDNHGLASLLVSDHHAVGTDFATAAGSFILATPTNGLGADENLGIWFTDPSGIATLTLPTLGAGWIYHAHIFHGGHAKSVGTFSATNVEDSDGRGPEGGPEPGFTAPGSDFLTSEPDLADGMAHQARRLAPAMSWSAVAQAYRRLAGELLDGTSGAASLLANRATV